MTSANDLGASLRYEGAIPTGLYRTRLQCGLARLRRIKILPITDERAKTLILCAVLPKIMYGIEIHAMPKAD